MRVVCLAENTAGSSACGTEHGLSFYIETKHHKVLMDTGASGLFAENAVIKGVDLSAVDTVVISHGHYDHGGGLPDFLKLNQKAVIYLQESAFREFCSVHEEGPVYIGLPEELKDEERITKISGNLKIDDELSLFAGMNTVRDIPSANSSLKVKSGETLEADDFSHEQCLVVKENGKYYLFSGCAHHGILNILDRFEELYGREPDGVFSGFHMKKKNGYTDEDINMIIDTALQLKKHKTWFRTCHCTGTAPYEAMKKIMGDQLSYIHSGDEMIISLEKKKREYMKMHKLFAWGTVFCFAMTMITGYKRK